VVKSTTCASSGPDQFGGYCHSSHIGQQTGENPVYLSSSRLLIEADLSACFGGGLPVLLAGDLNAKHVDWNSLLNTRRGKLLCDYADYNSCLIFGPDIPTNNPYNPSANPDDFDIVIAKEVPFPAYLTSCSQLSSEHFPVLIDTACRSSFLNTHRIALISGALTGLNSKLTWKIKFRSIRNCTTG
jgi:hypothetical protein